MRMENSMRNSSAFLAVVMRFSFGAAVALCVTPVLLAQTSTARMPHVENAPVEQRAISAPIAAEVKKLADQSAQAQWIGYAVPEVASDREVCCNNNGGDWNNGGCGVCRLEDGNHGVNMTSRSDNKNAGGSTTGQLQGSRQLLILLRTPAKPVMKNLVVSEECTLHACGASPPWLYPV